MFPINVPSTGTYRIGARHPTYLDRIAGKPVNNAINSQYQIMQNTLLMGYSDMVNVRNFKAQHKTYIKTQLIIFRNKLLNQANKSTANCKSIYVKK